VSIYQDTAFDGSRYVSGEELCLFNKTQLLIAHDASGIGGAARADKDCCVQSPQPVATAGKQFPGSLRSGLRQKRRCLFIKT